ncbi:MAG: T9SS type A sorting domain-containing protein [Candidatus Eisenbacteria bacterium]|nr:T9SS type A sorting domain-containing protein [Candidatus Eisenbacteria bacterium]
MRTLVQLISVSLLLGIVAAPSNAQLVVTLGDRPIGIDDGLTLDADGNLYGSSFINGTNGRIRIVTPQGIDSVFCTQLEGPLGHDFGPDGTLYVASYYQGTVSGVDANGDATVLVSGISRPSGVVYGPDGYLYVTEYGVPNNHGTSIYRVGLDGSIELFASDPLFDGPVGVDFDEAGNLYVGSFNRGHITRVTPEGVVEFLATVPGPDDFNTGYIAYKNGNIYATGIGTHKIYRLDLGTLELSDYAGTGVLGYQDGDAATARFYRPNGLVMSAGGDTLYVSEYGNKTVRMIISGDTSSSPEVHGDATARVQLEQNVPNPSIGMTSIRYALASSEDVVFQVFDVQGREVLRAEEGIRSAGSHVLDLDTRDLANGIYTYRLRAGGKTLSRQMSIVR